MDPTSPPTPAQPDDAVIVVPLSCIPESTGIVTTSSNASVASPGAKSCSSSSSASSTSSVAGTKPGRSRASMLALAVNHPQQVPEGPSRRHKLLAVVGRVGCCGKAVVYALIGGLACDSAAANRSPAPVSTTCQVSASPQGAFVLMGTIAGGLNVVMLIVVLVALVCYITWRFWEGLAGQGYDKSFSAKKNFFKFRVSPLVSGCVYVSYLAFILQLLNTQVRQVGCSPGRESWPATWRYNTGGKVGLALLGLAFLIATCIQLQGVLSRQWHRDYRDDLPRPFMRAVFIAGHIGFAGRAAAFLAMAVLFLKDASGAGEDAVHNSSMVSNALLQLQQTTGLRALLAIIGVLLVCYGLFATLSSVAREFPTLPPTRRKALPADKVLAQPADEEPGHTTAAAAASGEGGAAATTAPVAAAAGHRSTKASKPSADGQTAAAVRFVEAVHGGGDDTRAARDGGFVTIELQ